MINEAIERAATQRAEADPDAPFPITVQGQGPLIALSEEAGAHAKITIPERTPQGPHVLIYSPTTRTWMQLRLPAGQWVLEREKPKLWQPGLS